VKNRTERDGTGKKMQHSRMDTTLVRSFSDEFKWQKNFISFIPPENLPHGLRRRHRLRLLLTEREA
jgi:hypothetical protein